MLHILVITKDFQAYKYIFSKSLSIANLSKLRKNILTILIKNTKTNNIFNLTNNKFIQVTNSKEYNSINNIINKY